MGYQIYYGPHKEKRKAKKGIITAVLLASLGIGTMLHPLGREFMLHKVVPEELRKALPAAESMAEDLRTGENFRNAWETFCAAVFQNAEIS